MGFLLSEFVRPGVLKQRHGFVEHLWPTLGWFPVQNFVSDSHFWSAVSAPFALRSNSP
jgi:hypothetical protein